MIIELAEKIEDKKKKKVAYTGLLDWIKGNEYNYYSLCVAMREADKRLYGGVYTKRDLNRVALTVWEYIKDYYVDLEI